MSKRKIVFGISALIIFITGLLLIIYGYTWFQKKQARVLVGTASPNFPYSDYSIDKLNELYPQYIVVETTQTPEETYKKFIDCLKKEDVDCAVQWVVAKERENYREITEKFISEGSLKEKLEKMDQDIYVKEDFNKEYFLEYRTVESNLVIDFAKNLQGVWLIKAI